MVGGSGAKPVLGKAVMKRHAVKRTGQNEQDSLPLFLVQKRRALPGTKTLRETVIASILSCLFVACTPQRVVTPAPMPATPPPPPVVCPVSYDRLVVMTVTQNRARKAKSSSVGGYSTDDVAVDIMTAEILRRGCRVVERQEVDVVLLQQGSPQRGAVDQATAVRLGKLAGAGAVIVADIYNTRQEYPQGEKSGGDASGKSGMNTVPNKTVEVSESGRTVYQVDMTVKMIEVQTAEVVYLEDKLKQSAPGEQTSHSQLLKDLVASLSFIPSPVTVSSDPPPEKPVKKSPRRSRKTERKPEQKPAGQKPKVVY
jgi:hypothetical protein